jgi:hypothetical protein
MPCREWVIPVLNSRIGWGKDEEMADTRCMLRRLSCFVCLAVLLVPFPACGTAAGSPLVGGWAFNYAPEEAVLLVREDGTAEYEGRAFSWEDNGTFLVLTDAETGEKVSLRYTVKEGTILLYLPKVYLRFADLPGEGLTGAWIGEESEGSTFIFREDHRFLEDGTFTGTFRADPEAGTFLLIYPQYFDDTLCYFRMEGNDRMTVEYPWPLVEWQKEPSE